MDRMIAASILALLAAGAASQEPTVDDGLVRGRALEARGALTAALELYTDLASRYPENWRVFMMRGSLSFRRGDHRRALDDFDRVVALAPRQEPYLWQRGIAQYYAGAFADCAAQFELHRTVNGADVENSVWHFLCRAKSHGLDAARSGLLPVGPDPRAPMSEIYDLFAGKAEVADVLSQAHAGTSRFYADLYVGLYLEATGDPEKARPHLIAAAESPVGGYMRDVARLHLAHRGIPLPR